MGALIISIGIFILIMIILLPIDKILVRRNLHKLILFLNESNIETNIKEKSYKEKILIYSEKLYKKLNIRIDKEKYEIYSNKLISLDLSEKITVESFIGLKVLSSISMSIFFILLALINHSVFIYICIVLGSIIAYYYPDNVINIKIKKRQEDIQKELPNILRTLAITVEAGLGFWEAIKKVCEIKDGIFINELKKVLMEVNMGILQKDALMNLSERCNVNEVTIFIFHLSQALEKGSSGIIKSLNEQADEIWEIRKNKAKEQGHKASIKLFLSMLIFVFPCLLIFLLGPAIISIVKFFGGN